MCEPVELLQQHTEKTVAEWDLAMVTGHFVQAARVAIDALKPIVRRKLGEDLPVEHRHFNLITRVMLNGLRDAGNLHLTTARDDWLNYPHAIEKAWPLALDASERLRYAASFLAEELPARLLEEADYADRVRQFVNDRFGPGLYSSPEIDILEQLCSVCREDPRGCSHIAGEIYDGERCVTIVKKFAPSAVAFVSNPHDPRCRIWSWNLREGKDGTKKIVNCLIMTSFRLEGGDSPGRLVDVRRLFRKRFKRVGGRASEPITRLQQGTTPPSLPRTSSP